ncbi:hypothetical protein CFIMG_006901RA [Ceratocystis fimbriata CBS 114723]|uniref:Uncharacterized protein n=1 Tax=Ceratocystis fimbriata CBS 114723 TaxID=1035309 RepID=A0A2C5WU11_9PEZI|nr:hypothetical protein CFIMG_006901RA [Ceratocystis fimbriata CBS 114723]
MSDDTNAGKMPFLHGEAISQHTTTPTHDHGHTQLVIKDYDNDSSISADMWQPRNSIPDYHHGWKPPVRSPASTHDLNWEPLVEIESLSLGSECKDSAANAEFRAVTRSFEATMDDLSWAHNDHSPILPKSKQASPIYRNTCTSDEYQRLECASSPVAFFVRKSEDSSRSRELNRGSKPASLPSRDGVLIVDYDTLEACGAESGERAVCADIERFLPNLIESSSTSQSSTAQNPKESHPSSQRGSRSLGLPETSVVTKNESIRNGSSVRNNTSNQVPSPAYMFALDAARELGEANDGPTHKRLIQGYTSPSPTPAKRHYFQDQTQQTPDKRAKTQQQAFQSPLSNGSFDATFRPSFGNGQLRVDSDTLPFGASSLRAIPTGSTFGQHMEMVGEEEEDKVLPKPQAQLPPIVSLPRNMTMDLERALEEALDREEQEYQSEHSTWRSHEFGNGEARERLASLKNTWGRECDKATGSDWMEISKAQRSHFGCCHLSTDSGILHRAINTALPEDDPHQLGDEMQGLPSVPKNTFQPSEPTFVVNNTPSQTVSSRKRDRSVHSSGQRHSLIMRQAKSKPEMRSTSMPLTQLTIQVPDRSLFNHSPIMTPLHTGISSAFDVSPPQKSWKEIAQGWGSKLKQRLGRKKTTAATPAVTRMQSVPILGVPRDVANKEVPGKVREEVKKAEVKKVQGRPTQLGLLEDIEEKGGMASSAEASQRASSNTTNGDISPCLSGSMPVFKPTTSMPTHQSETMGFATPLVPAPVPAIVSRDIVTQEKARDKDEPPRQATPVCDHLTWGLPPIMLIPGEIETLSMTPPVGSSNSGPEANEDVVEEVEAETDASVDSKVSAEAGAETKAEAQTQAQPQVQTTEFSTTMTKQSCTEGQEQKEDQDQGHEPPQPPPCQQPRLQSPGSCREKAGTPTTFWAGTGGSRLRLPFLRHRHTTGIFGADHDYRHGHDDEEVGDGDKKEPMIAKVSGEPVNDTNWLKKMRDVGWLHRA